VVGACATLRHRKGHNDAMRLWASGMLERKTVKYKVQSDRGGARQQDSARTRIALPWEGPESGGPESGRNPSFHRDRKTHRLLRSFHLNPQTNTTF
jgi:hypothetical protein